MFLTFRVRTLTDLTVDPIRDPPTSLNLTVSCSKHLVLVPLKPLLWCLVSHPTPHHSVWETREKSGVLEWRYWLYTVVLLYRASLSTTVGMDSGGSITNYLSGLVQARTWNWLKRRHVCGRKLPAPDYNWWSVRQVQIKILQYFDQASKRVDQCMSILPYTLS